MKRIRYQTTSEEGILISVRKLYSETNGQTYAVVLDTNECTYTIKNLSKQSILSNYKGGENINNLTVLKRKIKTHLEQLGVLFDSEIRTTEGK